MGFFYKFFVPVNMWTAAMVKSVNTGGNRDITGIKAKQ
jgi:hypothetical protein